MLRKLAEALVLRKEIIGISNVRLKELRVRVQIDTPWI